MPHLLFFILELINEHESEDQQFRNYIDYKKIKDLLLEQFTFNKNNYKFLGNKCLSFIKCFSLFSHF